MTKEVVGKDFATINEYIEAEKVKLLQEKSTIEQNIENITSQISDKKTELDTIYSALLARG